MCSQGWACVSRWGGSESGRKNDMGVCDIRSKKRRDKEKKYVKEPSPRKKKKRGVWDGSGRTDVDGLVVVVAATAGER